MELVAKVLVWVSVICVRGRATQTLIVTDWVPLHPVVSLLKRGQWWWVTLRWLKRWKGRSNEEGMEPLTLFLRCQVGKCSWRIVELMGGGGKRVKEGTVFIFLGLTWGDYSVKRDVGSVWETLVFPCSLVFFPTHSTVEVVLCARRCARGSKGPIHVHEVELNLQIK